MLGELLLKAGLEPGSVKPRGNRERARRAVGRLPVRGHAAVVRDHGARRRGLEEPARARWATRRWARDAALRHRRGPARAPRRSSTRSSPRGPRRSRSASSRRCSSGTASPPAPSSRAPTMLDDPHFQAWRYAREVEVADLGRISLEGPCWSASAMADADVRPAPKLGEHTREIARRAARPLGRGDREARRRGRARGSAAASAAALTGRNRGPQSVSMGAVRRIHALASRARSDPAARSGLRRRRGRSGGRIRARSRRGGSPSESAAAQYGRALGSPSTSWPPRRLRRRRSRRAWAATWPARSVQGEESRPPRAARPRRAARRSARCARGARRGARAQRLRERRHGRGRRPRGDAREPARAPGPPAQRSSRAPRRWSEVLQVERELTRLQTEIDSRGRPPRSASERMSRSRRWPRSTS